LRAFPTSVNPTRARCRCAPSLLTAFAVSVECSLPLSVPVHSSGCALQGVAGQKRAEKAKRHQAGFTE
jgi:hypothetical protein